MAESSNPNGIQILAPSQYLDVYKISTYGGAPAMITKPDSVQLIWLDKEFDRPEFLPSNISKPIKINDIGTSDFKINIHLGYPGGKKVGNWSEDGSQVFATADDLKDFFANCEKHRTLYDNSFSYTLVTKDDWDTAVRNVQANKNSSKNATKEKEIAAVKKPETPAAKPAKPVQTEDEISFKEYQMIVKTIENIYRLGDNNFTPNGEPLFKAFKGTFEDDVEGALLRLEETLAMKPMKIKQTWFAKLNWNKIKNEEHKKLFKVEFNHFKKATREKNNEFYFNLPTLVPGEGMKQIIINADF